MLEAFAAGRIRRLIVTMPPQHGKSVGATTLLPAYLLGLDPDLRVAVASYRGRWPRSSTAACSASSNRGSTPPFSRHGHQAGSEARGLHPHGRRGRDHRPPGRTALRRARKVADGQPCGLLRAGRPL
ncbi:MAG: hypothetical protein V8Q54_00630 [Alistipes senegalensis]